MTVPAVEVADVAALTALVDRERLEADVRSLCESSRHVQDDTEQARAAARWVASQFETAGLVPREIEEQARGVSLPVVLTEIAGARQDLAFVISAHYDTVRGTPGADDNASGVAGVLEIARVLAGVALPVSLVLAAVPFEEGDSMQPGDPFFDGATALARDVCSRSTVVGMLSLEMIGFTSSEADALAEGKSDYLAIVGNLDVEAMANAIVEAATQVPGLPRVVPGAMDVEVMPDVARSDHAAFWAFGVPAAMATDTANFRNSNYHKPTDTPDTLDYAFMAGAVRAVIAGALAFSAQQAER